jgi:aspartyl-tRNA(Asn)/glutamyl-tRNA(Gln) amidotransferase subunit C
MISIDIVKLEQLSKIRLTPEEHAMLSAQLPSIFEYVAKLQEVNTDGVNPAAYISDLLNVSREDVAQEDVTVRDAALALFPEKKASALQVPSVGARTKKKSAEEIEN